jgi:hypothetical protein
LPAEQPRNSAGNLRRDRGSVGEAQGLGTCGHAAA